MKSDHQDLISTASLSNNPKDLLATKKPNLALVPSTLIAYAAIAFEIGARKYGAYNWRSKKVSAMTYIAAIKRHCDCYLDGETEDAEGNKHLGAILASAGILADATETGNLVDDRPPFGAAPRLLAERPKAVG